MNPGQTVNQSSPGAEGTGASQGNMIQRVLATSGHPTANIFHVAFRLAALSIYILGGILMPDSIVFILVIVLSAVDFWVVQKVTGRLLVGLRWQCQFQEDGTEKWEYEEYANNDDINKTDKYIFWGALFGFPAVWGLFMLACLLTFDAMWFMCDAIVMALLVTNARGFFKCNKSIRSEIKGALGKEISKQASQQMAGAMMGGKGISGLLNRQDPN